MVVNRRFLYWGVFLVALGSVILVAQAIGADRDTVTQAWQLWPVLVIALGAGLLLRHTRMSLAGGMLAAATPGLLLGGLVVAGPQITPDCRFAEPGSFTARQGSFDGPATVDLMLACGELSVTTTPGSGWELRTGDTNAAAPRIDVAANRLGVRSSGADRAFRFPTGGDTWRVVLPTAETLDLTAEVNAGRGTFDLAGARLGSVRLAVNAGETRADLTGATVGRLVMEVNAAKATVLLPDATDFAAQLEVNAGALTLCAPEDLGLRIHENVVLGATTYAGLVRNGDAWESRNNSFATRHADVTVSVNVGSVDVNPVGGCK